MPSDVTKTLVSLGFISPALIVIKNVANLQILAQNVDLGIGNLLWQRGHYNRNITVIGLGI